ncbi:hypothetical protein YC2023_027805 [Brassica napus]
MPVSRIGLNTGYVIRNRFTRYLDKYSTNVRSSLKKKFVTFISSSSSLSSSSESSSSSIRLPQSPSSW